MSLTLSIVAMCGSSALAELAPQAAAYRALLRFQYFMSRWVLGTKFGRPTPKDDASQCSDGVLAPTPRGSQPTTSYGLPTPLGICPARYSASPVPDAPGPPGLASRMPW